MKKIFLLFTLATLFSCTAYAQLLCSPNGSIVMFTNYDGGTLNINVDVNMPNLKICIVSYEAVSVNLSGAYVNNVTAVHYAGYNSQNNNNCGAPVIPTTVINGAPVGVTPVIQFAPTSPLANANGNPTIVCGYSCDTNAYQGGCNTVDQIQAYFMAQYPGSIVRFHKVQYGCWQGTQTLTGAGNCCLAAVANNLSISTTVIQPTCNGLCNGFASVTATGGTPPYTYQWTGGPAGPNNPNLCPGTYTVVVTDAANNSASQVVTIINPAPIVTNLNQTACFSYFFNGTNITNSGLYKDTLQSATGCDSVINLNLTINTVNNAVNQTGATLTAVATGASYVWLKCNPYSVISGAVAQSYTPSLSGNYAVEITQNGCKDTSICKTVVVSGLDQLDENTIIHVYPNPINNALYIDVDAAFVGKKYALFDAVGKLISSEVIYQTSNQLNVEALSKGIYFLQMEGVNKKWKVQK
ncbi:MAG: T9SS type A sorting domain-containing protein [Bacteroidetes bacterium]|nr:T9SS type A sorting domain-containing protein [Bacteroidota bacterium]